MFYAALLGLASGYCFDLITHYFLFGSFQTSHTWLVGSSDTLNLLPPQDLFTCCSFYSNNHSLCDPTSSSFTLFRALIKYQPITITLHSLPYLIFFHKILLPEVLNILLFIDNLFFLNLYSWRLSLSASSFAAVPEHLEHYLAHSMHSLNAQQ